MEPQKIKSLMHLAWGALHHTFNRIFRTHRHNLNHFYRFYRNDRCFPITPEFRKLLPNFSSCLSCSLCDTQCPLRDPATLSPSFIMRSLSRSLTDFYHFDLKHECKDCRQCEEICPQNIPIKQVFSFIKQGQQIM